MQGNGGATIIVITSGTLIQGLCYAFRTKRVIFSLHGCPYFKYNISNNTFCTLILQVSTDGYMYFTAEEFPLIAPFLANVDTRGTGTVFYRQTDDIPLMTGQLLVQYFEDISLRDFSPTALFIATWDGVGSYNQNTHLVSCTQSIE